MCEQHIHLTCTWSSRPPPKEQALSSAEFFAAEGLMYGLADLTLVLLVKVPPNLVFFLCVTHCAELELLA